MTENIQPNVLETRRMTENIQPNVLETRRRTLLLGEQPKTIKPLDYEAVVDQRKAQMDRDPHRELLLCPEDDLMKSHIPRQMTTMVPSEPQNAEQEVQCLISKECIKTYSTSGYNIIDYKYKAYSGGFCMLPSNKDLKTVKLLAHVFGIDEDEEDEDSTSQRGGIVKQGWLQKVVHTCMTPSLVPLMRTERRFFQLNSYILNSYEDQNCKDIKGSTCLESCIDVLLYPKISNGIQLRMKKHSDVFLSADSEAEMKEWMVALKQTLESNSAPPQDRRRQEESRSAPPQDRRRQEESRSAPPQDRRNGGGSQDHSVPLFMHYRQYAWEKDQLNEGRLNMLCLDPETQRQDCSGMEANVESFRQDCSGMEAEVKSFSQRILVSCHDLTFNLQGCVSEKGDGIPTNVEPFFISLALFDVSKSRKISADFHVDLNPLCVRDMLTHASSGLLSSSSSSHQEGGGVDVGGASGRGVAAHGDGLPVLQHVSQSLLRFPTKGIFSVTNPHSDIFLVARVEKVLQNSIIYCAEPYTKTYNINKTTQEVLKVAKQTCQHLGQYRMPFAWATKQVFKDPQGTLDVEGKFSPLYRQNSSKISNENIIGLLADISKPDKSKLLTIPGQLNISIECVPSDISNTVTSSYVPVKPLEEGCEKVSVEIEEFLPEEAKYHVPFTSYQNHLYIYPLQLKDIKQKAFTKARNIAVCIQLRDSDEEGSSPLKCIYGKPGETLFTSSAYAAVLHSKQSPEFYEEIKMELPVHVHQKHHVLFSFYHINCEVNGKDNVKDRESLVGFSWVPLLTKGRMQCVNVQLPVSTTLPPGYLGDMSVESQKSQPDIKWVENAMPLFKVKTHVASTIYTQDQHLHNFFEHCQLMRTTSDVNPAQLIRVVKALHATENRVIINFLPTVLRQVFEVLAMATQEADDIDIASDSLHVIVHMVSLCHKEGVERYLRTFLKYEFMNSDPMPESYGRTHHVLARAITAMLEQRNDFIRDALLKHSWFFFESLAKSMVKYLQEGNRMKMPRAQRFPDSFHQALRSLLLSIMPHINERHQEIPEEARCINMSLATFIKSCLTFMDRGFAFSLINDYLCGITGLKDNQVLSEIKLNFLVSVCNHEHYIPLNLPMVLGSSTLVQEFSLTEDYCSNHFLVGLLLRQVGGALRHEGPHRGQQQGPHVAVLKNLLIKHAMDGRYAADKNQARICLLYLPLLELLYQNLKQLSAQPNISSPDALPRRGSAAGPLLPGKQGQSETRGLLQCFLHIVTTLSKDTLLAYWNQLSPQNISNFLSLLELCQVQFRYTGKKTISRSQLLTSDRKSQNLAAMPSSMVNLVQARVQQFTLLSLNTGTGPSEAKAHHQALLEGNMSTEAYLTVLDVLSLFTDCFKTQLLDSDGHNLLMKKVFDLYLTFLKVSQSEAALGHVFTALKAFISNFPSVLFTGRVILCETLCYEVLRCCMSNPASLRSEASALLYLLIQTNYEFTERKSFLRTDLQIIIAMIQLISDVTVTDQMCQHVQDSLSIINSLAKSDLSNFTESDKPTAFPVAVEGLTQRICTVLKVTTQMREHEKDPEMLLDLEYGLARSYASTPQLRCTWLDNMAQAHLKNGDMSEAAMCYVHIAALVAEYLYRKKLFPSGVEAFHKITFNIHEEAAMMEDTKEDTGMQDSYYTEEVLVEKLEWCVEALVEAERYELVTHIASLLIPMYDKRHLFKKLRDLHGELQKAYTKVILFMQPRLNSRLLGTYYRVAFYGKEFKEEDRKQYIYKEPKITKLSEIQNRLQALYGEKFGAENIMILQDSNKVKSKDLDPRFAYIQLTSVEPYFEEEEADTKTDFEKVHNIKRFMFETPYTLVGKKHGGIEDQWKRRTLLTTSHTFPYVKKRMEVVHQEEQELEPLSIAIDEVRKRTSTLTRLCTSDHVDTKMLQLQLSGSVAAKVNPGPVAYARAFLDDSKPTQSTKEAKDLKERFRKFVQVCMVALDTNESLIKDDQLDYHKELMNQFNTMVEELSALIN